MKNSHPENDSKRWQTIIDGILKNIIQPGDTTTNKPNSGSILLINYTLSLKDGTIIESNDKIDVKIDSGVNLKGWDIALKTMNKGEKSEFIISPEYTYGEAGFPSGKIPANEDLYYTFELVNIVQVLSTNNETKQLTANLLKEKIAKSTSLKQSANELFKTKEYYRALEKYKEGLEMLYGEGLSKEARDLMMAHNLNICNCFNNLGLYEETIERMKFSLRLSSSHPKIYYYRGMAYVNLNKLEEAEKDLDSLFGLTNDSAVQILKNAIAAKRKDEVSYQNFNIKNKSDNSEGDENQGKTFKCFLKSSGYAEGKDDMKKGDDSSDDDKEPINIVKCWD